MKRWLFLAYGLAGHAIFLATYFYLGGFVGNVGVPKSIDAPVAVDMVRAVTINLLLVAVFAAQHSVMARPAFKRVWTRWVPQPIERATYVWMANAVTILLMWQWQPIDIIVWNASHPVVRGMLWFVFAAGWLAVPLVSLLINHFDLFGTRQVWLNWRNQSYTDLPFRTPSAYAYVRHPLYVGWALFFWATPTMTVGHLLFAASLTVYMALATIVEERDLVAHFGQKYRDYQMTVGRFVPRLARGTSTGSQLPNSSTARSTTRQLADWSSRVAVLLVFVAGATVLLLWLAGKFAPKVSLQTEPVAADEDTATDNIAAVRLVRVPRVETAVGNIRPVHETTIGSKLLARVVEVSLKAGQLVKAGEILVRLDDLDLRARRRQAEAVLHAAEAGRAQAEADANRAAELVKTRVVSPEGYERSATGLKSAAAELSRAKEALNEIETTLDWATIRSPIEGIVIDKKVAVGDMVMPGQMLLALFDPKRMQFVASVRESLAHRLKVGQEIDVQIENFNRQCTGTISEIVPEAESSSRAFQVKVTGPCPEGAFSGMFGRILIPLEEEQVLVVPRQAVKSVGQLHLVNLADHGSVTRRAIRLGRTIGEDVEVLSGLREGE